MHCDIFMWLEHVCPLYVPFLCSEPMLVLVRWQTKHHLSALQMTHNVIKHVIILWKRRVDGIITYRKTSNIIRTLVGNEIVDHSDVVGAPPVGAAPTTSSFST